MKNHHIIKEKIEAIKVDVNNTNILNAVQNSHGVLWDIKYHLLQLES